VGEREDGEYIGDELFRISSNLAAYDDFSTFVSAITLLVDSYLVPCFPFSLIVNFCLLKYELGFCELG
jgi:hypothetical protein